jgi:hypothetical protein
MNSVHLVIADLFLPRDFAVQTYAGLHLPALEKILTGKMRSSVELPFEEMLGNLFCVSAIAPVSAAFDGLTEGYWMRADPVHLQLHRDQVKLLTVDINHTESAQLVSSLNEHYACQGLIFYAPHPERWYLRLEKLPDMTTSPLSFVLGQDIRSHLPSGADALHWRKLFNDIQMFLFSHPLNEMRESSGHNTVNSLWFWGMGGKQIALQSYDVASSDESLLEMLASSAAIPYHTWHQSWQFKEGRQLLVWSSLRRALQNGDLIRWRSDIQEFETEYLQPLWKALRSGRINRLQVDIIGDKGVQQIVLTPFDTLAFWRIRKSLARYPL